MSVAQALLTAEEFADLPDDGRSLELVEGRIIELPPPQRFHGKVCFRVAWVLGGHVMAHDLGTILTNDSGIITRRDPDSVRGADVAYYSYARMPRDSEDDGYSEVAPELIFEVKSPSNRWRDVEAKVTEYLNLGSLVVCVLDPETKTARLYRPDQPARVLGPDDELTFPECLPGFVAAVTLFFK